MKFLKSALLPKDYPEDPPKKMKPEVALVGRSNAGKSSLLNRFAEVHEGPKNKYGMAKVSQTPGKTRLLNFFDYGDKYRYVDMPGYGFAGRASDEIHQWQESVEVYLSMRGQLCGVVIIMDIKRDWDQHEQLLHQFLNSIGLRCLVVVTKIDKLSVTELKKRQIFLENQIISTGIEKVFFVSSTKNIGMEAVEKYIFMNWVKEKIDELKSVR